MKPLATCAAVACFLCPASEQLGPRRLLVSNQPSALVTSISPRLILLRSHIWIDFLTSPLFPVTVRWSLAQRRGLILGLDNKEFGPRNTPNTPKGLLLRHNIL